MSLSVQQIFQEKFKEIQSRLPVKMNTPSDVQIDFQQLLEAETSNLNQTTSSSSINGSYGSQIEAAINNAASKYNVDPNLIKAIIKAESGFNPYAVSKSGAQGLMQLMPSTARGLGVTNSFDINQNVDAGTRYIKEKLSQFGNDPKLALAAYNAGPNSVIKYNGIPPYPETQNYVKTVLKYYTNFSQ